MRREAKMILLLSDARGLYIPRDFAREVKRECITGVTTADLDYLARGPDDIVMNDDADDDNSEPHCADSYWDVWRDVCDRATVTDPSDGTVYTVYQDGDCWLVEQGATWNGDGADEPDDTVDCMYYMDDGQEVSDNE